MRRVIILFMFVIVAMISIGANHKPLYILPGENSLYLKPVFSSANGDTLIASSVDTISISNKQKYNQMQYFTINMTATGAPSVTITAEGKINLSGDWVTIGTPITWTTTANNGTISSTSAINYNYLRVRFAASGATQRCVITKFEVTTVNIFPSPTTGGTYTFTRPDAGTVTITAADNNADCALTVGAGGTGALTIGDTGSSTTITSSGTVAITGSNVEIGTTSANETTPSLVIQGDADSDAGGDTDEALTIDLTTNATPTSAVWDVTSTQSAGYRFDKSVKVGPATANDVQPTFVVQGDADSDAGGDTQEALTFTLTPNATPTLATWGITSTQSAGYTFDKKVVASGYTIDNSIGGLVTTATANEDSTVTASKLTAVNQFVTITSGGATRIITLPVTVAGMVGMVISGYVAANGFNLRVATADRNTVYLNNAKASGGVEAAIPQNTWFTVRCVSATYWILSTVTNTGAAGSTITPDAID